MTPRLALVTILYQSDAVLDDFFKSLHAQTYQAFTIYVVDNSASPETDQVLADCMKRYPLAGFRYINSGANVGVAAGNNIGIRAALADKATHVLLLNNDIVFEQTDLLQRMLGLATSHAMITPKIFYYDTNLLWMAGGYMDHWRALGVHEGMQKKDSPAFSVSKPISYAPTCFLMIRSEVFSQTGLMDEAYFCYYDDTDFVWRAQCKGFDLWYDAGSSLRHKVSSSSGGDASPFYIYYANRNKIYFIRKHYRFLKKAWLLAYTLLSRMVFYLRFDSVGRKKMFAGLKDGFRLPVTD